MGSVHAFEANFHVKCGLDGCPRSYTNYHSYKKHLYIKHRERIHSKPDQPDQSLPETQADSEPELDMNDSSAEEDMGTSTMVDHTRQSALLLLKTTAIHKSSKASLDEMIGDISVLFGERLTSVQHDIQALLEGRGMAFDAEIAAIFQKPIITTPFQGLHSEFLRQNFYKTEFGLIVSFKN